MTELKLDWCSYKAAKYAVEHWHYSKSMPAGKSVKIGVWENEKFIGAIIFSMGANRYMSSPYKLEVQEACELTRVALRSHETPVSKMLSLSIKMLKSSNPGLRLIISYADSNQGHLGGIYQATNWVYEGEFANERGILINGNLVHRRTINARYGTSSIDFLQNHIDKKAQVVTGTEKYKYLYPLDDDMRKQIEPLRKPYPKRGRGEIDNASQSNEKTGGASPTRPL